MKVKSSIVIFFMILFLLSSTINASEKSSFKDVPTGHYAEGDINDLRELGVIDGYGQDVFGFGDTLTRAQFVAFLGKLNQWEMILPDASSFIDNESVEAWYYAYIETALLKGVIDNNEMAFRPNDLITREEMSLMIVNSLGYTWLANSRQGIESPFEDVSENIGYVSVLKDFGIINGRGENIFDPEGYAKREEAAAILMRMYKRMHSKLDETNAFYAIKSYHQSSLMENFDTISFSWAHLRRIQHYGSDSLVELVTNYPDSYELPIEEAKSKGKKIYLSVFADDFPYLGLVSGYTVTTLLESQPSQEYLINAIVEVVDDSIEFDGITIDFESILGQENRDLFASFIDKLAASLHGIDKELVVMAHPLDNYDGYDYARILRATDRMILMAHDYHAKNLTVKQQSEGYVWTPVAPIESVYDSIRQVKESVALSEFEKISLQISFDTAQWKMDSAGKVINSKAYTPLYEGVYTRLLKEGTSIQYGNKSRSPYATYINEDTNEVNYIWYEDEKSISEKIEIAKMFGISDISVWRLGNIPTISDITDKNINMDVMHLFGE